MIAEVIRNCVTCRKIRRPPESQRMAVLPRECMECTPPFTNVGMDVFGPFMIKKGRSEIKCYGLMVTCLYSRAVHIEMLDDLSTDKFIVALRCVLALRGPIKTIFCDQGTNFIGAERELQLALKEFNVDKASRYLAECQCEFRFNTPCASHHGGVWERQIKTVRNVLRATLELSKGRLDDSSLRALFYEAAYIVNSRPLSPKNLNDPLEENPLTPNSLLHQKNNHAMPPAGDFVQQDVYGRKAWRRLQYLSEQFWSRWRREYLSTLRDREKWTKEQRNIKVGDIVMLIDENSPRCESLLGLVTKANVDQDGLVRKAEVRISNIKYIERGVKQRVTSTLQRPVQKLVLLVPTSDSADGSQDL
jgi:hypothetical protein